MSLLNKLQLVQEKHGYLTKEELAALAKEEDLSLAQVIGRASFYEFFSFKPETDKSYIENIYPCRKAGILLNAPENYSWIALAKAKTAPEAIIPAIKAAGLLGRGGGGFPVWQKWQTTKDAQSDEKYVVCNADEGEPGTGKDRVLIERNPKAIIEGMAVCAVAVGAKKGFIYLRGEYADLKEILETEIAKAPLGDFEIEVYMGHGAYVCGEETALLGSLEGKRGETRLKPPYPGVAGLWGKPTVVNNVESFACVPFILEYGAENFRKRGTSDYPGTKLYTVSGAVKKPGVYEMEAGITLAELLEAAGGETEALAAVQLGGGSGNLLDADCMEMRLTIEGCAGYGGSLGTGAVRFVGMSENLIFVARELTEFYAKESCGMCVPCRVGLKKLAQMLEKAEKGQAWPDDIEAMRELAEHIKRSARCGLAQAAVSPALSLMENFPEVLK